MLAINIPFTKKTIIELNEFIKYLEDSRSVANEDRLYKRTKKPRI